jgi:hypothetical protein
MNIEVFVLCEAANDSQGKLNLLGTFDTIIATNLPALHPQCAIVARVRFLKKEGSKHTFNVTIKNPDDSVNNIPINNQVIDSPSNAEDDTVSLNLIINIVNLKFEKYGTHQISIDVDKEQKLCIPLYIKSHN